MEQATVTNSKPLVSIGMPVYNGEKYIRYALNSLLAQDFTDFELIISDNASTDETWKICQEYAAKDSRIRLYRNKETMGGYSLRVLELSSGKYFMWAAHDDVWKLHFISELVNLLEVTPSAVLAVCRAEKIDYNDISLHLGPIYLTTVGMTRAERLRYFSKNASGWLFHGLYRREIPLSASSMFLDKRQLIGASEAFVLYKCINSGDLVFSENVLFLKRQSSPDRQEEASSSSLFKLLRGLFWYCYTAFFKCYHLRSLNPWQIGLIYWAIIQGLPQRPFYHQVIKSINRIGPLLFILRISKSILLAPVTWRRKLWQPKTMN